MTLTENHHSLDTNMIFWPRIRDILGKVLLEIEQGVWEEKFDSPDNGDEIEGRNPNDLGDEPNMPLHLALEAAPGLRKLLDEAITGFVIPDHVGNSLDHAFEAAVGHVTRGLSSQEMEALGDLAETIIRNGDITNPEGLTVLDPEHIVHTVRTRDIAAAYETVRTTPGWGLGEGMPPWDEVPSAERARVIGECRMVLEAGGAVGNAELVDFVRAR